MSWVRNSFCLLGIFITLIVPRVHAADDFAESAQGVLEAKVAEHGLAGVSAAVMRDGEIVWSGGAGLRDMEGGLPADRDMVHRIASITKAMTATAVMQLVEQGKIDLDARLQEYLPGFPVKTEGEIRIHHLLTHTSGIKHYQGRENRPTEYYATLQDAVELFQDRPLSAAPGKEYTYTTYCYTVLGRVIEAASGQAYGEYMQEHVFGPAGMVDTQLETRELDVTNRSKPYRHHRRDGLVPDTPTDLSVKYPGGGLVSTAEDLVRFGHAFVMGELVTPETVQRMLVVPEVEGPRPVPYGYGWMFWDDAELGRVLYQDGGQSGTSTELKIYPDQGIIIAVIGNTARTGAENAEIRQALLELALGR